MRKKKTLLWAVLLITIVIICKLVSDHYYQLMLIQGDSMRPAYRSFQLVLLDKRDRDFRKGDVVAFRCDGLSSVLVKRIAAVPGDRVVIVEGTLKINGENSPFYKERLFAFSGLLENEICLSDGEYIVIGDNTDESKDSRYKEVGIISADTIIGIVIPHTGILANSIPHPK